MKANEVYSKAAEFVKQYGWEYAKHILTDDAPLVIDLNYTYLKRIIDSYELIKKDFESVEMAEYEYMVSASYNEPYWVRVKQAILDVESCK